MDETKPNIVGPEPTKQTVAIPWEEWQAIQGHIRRVRGRTFGRYVLDLIRKDMECSTQTGDNQTLIVKFGQSTTGTSEPSDTMPVDRQTSEVELALNRMADAIEDVGKRLGRLEQKARPDRAAKAKAS